MEADFLIKRELYMSRIRPFIGTELVKVMTGIRRCGKSVMLDLIKEELKESGVPETQFIAFNFEDMRNANLCTAQALHCEVVNRASEISGKVYLFFDEIQEAPKALASLKYFYENAPQYSIIAAGSLLGVALHQGTSFPVGKVDFLKLCPMSFSEFLLAVGENGLYETLKAQDYELINAYAGKYVDLLKKYYYVGGMPEVVQTYIDSDDLYEVREIQNNLLTYYEEDFSKHAPKEVVPRIMMVWNSIPSQLAKENRKFMYGALREGARAKDFELAIQWLEDAGLILRSYRVSKPDIPLIAYMEMNSFKMFMFDVGLLTAKAGLFEEFKGALTEQYVAQELHAAGYPLYYFATERSTGEINFMLQGDLDCIPIEVKAEQNLRAKSLKAFCDKYQPDMAVRSSMANYKKEDWLINVPLYMLAEYLKNMVHVN